MKIANRISLSFLTLIILLTVIVSSVFYLIARDNLQNAIYAQLEITAQQSSRNVATYLEMLKIYTVQFSKSVVLEDLLQALRKSPQAGKETFDTAMKRLKRTKAENPEIYEFLLLDASGRVVASSDEGSIGLDKSKDAYFLNARKNVFIKDAYYSEQLKERLIAVSAPFLDSSTDEFIGVLVARVKMIGIDKILAESAGASKTGEVYIVNKYGYMITPSKFLKDTFLKQKVDTLGFKNRLLDRQVTIFPDYRGVKVLGSHMYIPEMQWYLMAQIDEKEAFAPLTKLYILFLIILSTVPLFAYLLSMYLARVIVGPIHRLQKGMEIIGAGNLEYKVATNARDEIGLLSRAFDDMTGNLQKSEERFHTMVNNVPGAIYRAAGDGNRTMDFISREIKDICGYPAEDFIGNKNRSYVSIIYPEDLQMVNETISKAVDSKIPYTLEYRIVSSDNSVKWVYEKGQGLFDEEGKLLFLDGGIFDVNEHKKRENRLVALNRAVEQSPAAATITDENGIITYVNPKFEEMTGYSAQEVIGQNPRILKSGHQGPAFYKELWETIRSGKTWHGEFHNKKKDGTFYWESSHISAVRNLKGEITSFIAVREDITERKRMLEELENKNRELLKLDTLKTEFVSVVSHELRTPLSIIKEGVSLVLDGVIGEINPTQNKILTTSKDNIDRLARIINSLLDISKIESGKVELKKKSVDLRVLIKNVVSLFEARAREKGLEIKVSLPQEGELNLYIDEDRIIQVFTNLIGNSLKFTEKGYIGISLVDEGNEIEFTVSDTGIGISAEDLPKVFRKFMQFGRVAGNGEKGTGLGLSIAKGLIELHNGRIWIESQPGKGSKFIFTLPRNQPA
ncbi:PAS domain S-box protein [bacterium]|nr:MAG: PAS domain S-box protein [bacterium]